MRYSLLMTFVVVVVVGGEKGGKGNGKMGIWIIWRDSYLTGGGGEITVQTVKDG